MADQYIVKSSAMLGFPNTDRTFLQDELVSEADFSRCPERFQALLARGSLKKANEDEIAAGQRQREKNDALHLGLDPASVPRAVVEQKLAEQARALADQPPPPKAEPKFEMPNPAPPEAPPPPLSAVTPAEASAPPVAVVANPEVRAELEKPVKKKGD